MTQSRAKQIAAYLKLTSAFYHVGVSNEVSAATIMDARREIADEMDADTLIAAIDISLAMDYSYNLQFPKRAA